MRRIFTLILLTIISLSVQAQDKILEELKTLTEQNQYARIIEQYSTNYNDFSAKSLYYIGQAYYMLEKDNECLKFMELSIKKDNQDPAPLFIKASALNYSGKYEDAIKTFESAINLKPEDALFYSGLGDSYYQLENFEKALDAYSNATKQNNCPDRPYSMIAQIYLELNQTDKALQSFYEVKSKINPESESYVNALFNIGLFESLKGNHDKAEPIFLELIKISPTDFHSYAKLIQIYYHKKEYEKAEPLKKVLYDAYSKGKMKGSNLEDMFCIDQFEWNNHTVLVFERYENENKGDIYNKHLFYVNDQNDKTVLRVQIEFSPISVELGGPKYLLCATQGSMHLNPGIGFNEGYKYDDLKAGAIKLFEKYLK